jgi:hypothetical protein
MHIARPSEESGIPLALVHPAERTEKSPPQKPSLIDAFFRFLRRAQHSFDSFDHICLPCSPESLVREAQDSRRNFPANRWPWILVAAATS